MMQVEFLQSWPDYGSIKSPSNETDLHFPDKEAMAGTFEIPQSSNVSSSVILSYPDDESQNFSIYCDESPVMFPMEQCFPRVEDVATTPSSDQFMADELKFLHDWIVHDSSPSSSSQFLSEDDAMSLILSPTPAEQSIDVPELKSSLVLPSEAMDVDHQLSLLHLLKAYGDAMVLEQEDLANEIARRLEEKASPTGSTPERLAYYLMQASENQVDFYLSRESSKNYDAAFRAFYQIFPYGRFAHFTANSTILEAIPEDAGIVHIVDFDIGEGVQWPPLIEALGRMGKSLVKLTSMKWEEEDSTSFTSTESFEETKNRLSEHAQNSGVRLKMEEMDMEGLVREIKESKKRGGRNEWLAFNCMTGLPHMGRVKSIGHVLEFLKVVKDSVNVPIKESNDMSRGILSYGNVSEVQNCSGFEPFNEGKLVQLQAFFESMESHFPGHFTEARTAMECLFMAPQVSAIASSEIWEERSQRRKTTFSEMGLKAWRPSTDTILEANKELVSEGESLFWVRTGGEIENQMILGYKETPLVTVASWLLHT